MSEDIQKIAEELSDGQKRLLTHERFEPKGWEPPNPFAPVLIALVEKGLFRRSDGRCGFELMKDAFVIPTESCLQVRAYLQGEPS